MTNLLALPELQFTWTIVNDQDWIEGISYVDQSDDPVALDGIEFKLTVRPAIGDPSVVFYASLGNGMIQILPASAESEVNSVWAIAVFQVQFPKFLSPGSYVFGLQGLADGNTRNVATGPLIVTQGVT